MTYEQETPNTPGEDPVHDDFFTILQSGDRIDEDGEGFTRFRTVEVPFNTPDEVIEHAVESYWPAERCHHDYDCCGRHYADRASWAKADTLARYRSSYGTSDQPPLTILVRQVYRLNI